MKNAYTFNTSANSRKKYETYFDPTTQEYTTRCFESWKNAEWSEFFPSQKMWFKSEQECNTQTEKMFKDAKEMMADSWEAFNPA